MRKLKRAVVKEELVALTGDLESALILNQFIYWSERVKDFDKFILEEAEIREKECLEKPNIQLLNGWIYKDMEELKSELMLSCSTVTVGRKLSKIVDNGWLDRRNNPEHKWDKRYQYRVNLNKIALDLYKLGYTLQDYKIDLKPLISSNLHFEGSNLHSEASRLQNEDSMIQNEGAISEITTEITKNNNNSTKILSTLKDTTGKKETEKDVVVNLKPKKEDEIDINSLDIKTEQELAKEEIDFTHQEVAGTIDKPAIESIINSILENLLVINPKKNQGANVAIEVQTKKETEEGLLAVKQIIDKYRSMFKVDDTVIYDILGPTPSNEAIERMENALAYIDAEYIQKSKKIKNIGGLIRCAYEKEYKAQMIDPVSVRREKQLAREREEWKKEKAKPKASPEVIQNGLKMLKSVLTGPQEA